MALFSTSIPETPGGRHPVDVNYLEGALWLGVGCVVVVSGFAGDLFGGFVRKRSNVFLQVLATSLVAQIVGAVFFATSAQQSSVSENSRDLLLSSAGSLIFTAMLTILGLAILIVFLAVDARRKTPGVNDLRVYRILHVVTAHLVVLATFVILAHLALTLPFVVIGPLI